MITKNMSNIGRDTSTPTVKGKKIYDVPGDSMSDIQGSNVEVLHTLQETDSIQLIAINVEIDDNTGTHLYRIFIDTDGKIAPISKTGGPEHDVY